MVVMEASPLAGINNEHSLSLMQPVCLIDEQSTGSADTRPLHAREHAPEGI